MSDTPSLPKAALWMGGWLSLMVVIAVAGREATRELAVFQIMEMRSIMGFALLYPLLRASGGLAAVRTARPGSRWRATSCTTRRSTAGSPP